ncbi:hypothetical protein B9Z40_05390 [Limnohabitans sp. 15K]|nr:hypothetical protein B9Z40_05390 [Limnohabitans sp. 15K]
MMPNYSDISDLLRDDQFVFRKDNSKSDVVSRLRLIKSRKREMHIWDLATYAVNDVIPIRVWNGLSSIGQKGNIVKINNRTVNFFELQVSTNSLDERIPIPPQVSLWKIVEKIIPYIKSGIEIQCGKTPIEVTQVTSDKTARELVLLLNKPDPDRSDVAYRRRGSKTRRLGNKAVDEDIEVSAHVLIKFNESSISGKMLMTTGAGIYPQKIVSLLNNVYKQVKKSGGLVGFDEIPLPTNILDDDGKKKKYKVKHAFSFSALPNGALTEIINKGRIVGVDLIDKGHQSFDSTVPVEIDRMEMHVNLKSVKPDIPYLKKLLKTAFDNRKFDADTIRIEYKERDVDDVQIKKKLFNAHRLEDAFTRSEIIELDNPHFDHQTKISEEIILKMKDLID